ncbi:fimbrillin family protein [Pedobacter sp. Hv1]|uniref:fimbrillin family protein n=1 Tax=Pedobacter sp. Hv1 TaxID=1740090 RepID=UPI0006D8B841|nr:fimbrillin family protein [Pedobacter sp. Hv1]KQC01803.1 hypothetical protein AQF98_05405 [Pedobacter sp. Hv1]
MLLKKQNILLATALSLLVMSSSCKKENTPEVVDPNATSVKFSSSINGQTLTNVANNSWEANDAIGVFMKSGTGLSNVLAANKNYNTTGDGNFKPTTSDQTIYFPEDGKTVDFVAYYPFKQSLSSNIYPVDLSNQSQQNSIDLLYSNNATGLSKSNANASLTFSHQLAKVEFTVKNGEGVANLTGLAMSLAGLNTKADFDLATGVLSNPSQAVDIAAKVGTRNTLVIAEAILLPVADASAKLITFTLPGTKFKFTLPSNTKFEAGKRYTYEIELKNVVGTTPVATALNAVITDWTTVPSGSYTVGQDEVTPPVTGVEEVVYTETFGTGAASSKPKVSAYTGWANSSLTFSDSFGTADLRTISAYPDNIHVWLPATKDASLKIEGVKLSGYQKLKLKYDLAPNASSSSSASDFNVITVKVNGVAITVPSRPVDFADNNKFSTIELTGITALATNTIEFIGTTSTNNLGMRLDNVVIIGIK